MTAQTSAVNINAELGILTEIIVSDAKTVVEDTAFVSRDQSMKQV